jgi:sulfate transporter 3
MANWNNLWQLVLVNPLAEVIEKLKKADEANDVMRSDYLFLTVEEAVAALKSALKSQPPSTEEEERHTLVTEC